jgi:hypothetical protein
MRTIQVGAVLAPIVFWSAAAAACDPPASFQLPFTPYAQQTSDWCWAASGQTTMNSIRPNSVGKQCEAVSRVVRARGGGEVDCCKPTTPLKCRIASDVPPYAEYKFDFSVEPEDRVLSFEEIKRQIYCQKKPFAFSWLWKPRYFSGHMMVVVGYKEQGGEKFVRFFNPSPSDPSEGPVTRRGRLKFLTYDEYLEDSKHLHAQAFYNISFRGNR